MTDAVLSVSFAGPHVSVQDGGRKGLMRFGVPASGPLDRLSFGAANLALGNAFDTPAIEISLGGLSLSCQAGEVAFAVAGGGFVVELNGSKHGSWMTGLLRAGDKLTIRRGHWGSWCYLAFAGKLQTPLWLGHASTHTLSDFGGGKLMAGQVWTLTDTRHASRNRVPPICPVFARPRHNIRVTIGPQDRFFAPETIATFLDAPWKMTDAWDRMGVRLGGRQIAPSGPLDMPSEPVLRGSVQVAGDGVPSVLLADHQTTGGYPKIATVLDCDLDGLVQLRPQQRLQFQAVTPAEAVEIARFAAERQRRYYDTLRKAQYSPA